MGAWDGLDRRKFPRINYPCLITIRQDESEKDIILTHTENIGIGGVCITLKKNLKIFSPVELELDLLDFGDHLKCPGKVVWAIRRKSEEAKKPLFYDIGIEFTGLNDNERKRMENVIQRLVKQNKAEVVY